MKIAVAGATGRVGRHVVEVAEERGHEVVRIARSTGVDVITAAGLADALEGADVVIDVSTAPTPDGATEFFTTSTRNLHQYSEQAGVRRIVVVSIVGIDNFTSGYSHAKLVHEKLMLAGPVPVTIVRATQFFEFVAQLIEWGSQGGDTIGVPAGPTQAIAARSAAEALVDAAENPSDAVVNVAGPQEESMVDLARLYAAHKGITAQIVNGNDPSDPDSPLYESGELLPPPDARILGPTFKSWLAEQ
jgi:uncharacterized protein YbjT (DUF2867 family)